MFCSFIILMICNFNFDTSFFPQSWKIDASKGEVICINSSIKRSIYSLGHSPSEINLNFIEAGYPEKSYNITEKSLIFAIEAPSSLSFVASSTGVYTFSAVSLDQYGCFDGIYVTNELKSHYVSAKSSEYVKTSKTFNLPLKIADQRCFYLASYGIQIASISANLSSSDSIDYLCDSIITKIDPTKSPVKTTCDNPETPLFIRLNTSAIEINRNLEIDFEVVGESTFSPMNVERYMTPQPQVQVDYQSTLSIVLVAVSALIVIAIIVIACVFFYLRFCKSKSQVTSFSSETEYAEILSQY